MPTTQNKDQHHDENAQHNHLYDGHGDVLLESLPEYIPSTTSAEKLAAIDATIEFDSARMNGVIGIIEPMKLAPPCVTESIYIFCRVTLSIFVPVSFRSGGCSFSASFAYSTVLSARYEPMPFVTASATATPIPTCTTPRL